ncbi:MAG: Trigger factor [Alphaproteobacteria bacterium MarineAlpha3_Bin3]|nr:MAG: Trigger factor [Alphaproteobacteria bacterium MarineAlpha3_Bin3]
MQVTETKSEGLSREFKVALPANEIEEKISHRLKELARTAQMPGFRPGKVPVSVLRKKYGPSVLGEVLERAVNDSSQQALAEKGLRPAMQPQIEITSFEDGGDLEYTIGVELLPEIKPVDFSKIKLERLIPKTDDAAMEKTLADIAAAQGDSAAIKDDRETKTGDVLVIDFLGQVGGEEFAGGKAEGYELTLGSGTFIPGFEEQLIGVKVGDKIEVKVKFPDSYGAAELSGKDAVFDVTVNELKETVPSAIDDELAKKVGMENLEALKKSIREEQESKFNEMSRMILKRALLDELSAAHDFEIPEKLLDREFDTIWKQFEEQRKKDKDAGQGSEEKTDDEHKKDFREIAERRVRLGLLLSEVGRANNVQISQEDVNSQLMAEARRHPGREKEVMEHYKNNPEAMEELSAPLYEEKVVNFILEQASITEKTATKDELIKTMEDEAAGKPKAKAKAGGKSKAKGKAAAEKKAAKKDK